MDTKARAAFSAIRHRTGIGGLGYTAIAEAIDSLGYTIVPIAEVEAGRALYEAVGRYHRIHDDEIDTAWKAYKAVLDD